MQKGLINEQPSTGPLKLIVSISHTDTSPCAAASSSQLQKEKNASSEKTEQSSLGDVLMSHKYNLRSRNSFPSEGTPSNDSNSSISSSAPTRPRSLPASISNSPYFTGFTPYFVPSYMMAEQQDQVNDVSGSQNNLNAIVGEDQDAQNLLSANEYLDRSPEEAVSVVDSVYKRNQTNSFLGRIKDDIRGLKDALIDQIAATIIDEEFQDVVEMVKAYNKVVGPLLDLPDDPLRDTGTNDFINAHKDEHKSLNEDMKSLKLKVQRLVTMDAMRTGATTQSTTARPASSHSALKLPRIQIPRFENNDTGTLD